MIPNLLIDFIVGAIMVLIVWSVGYIYRRLKNGYIPPGPSGEDYSNTVIFTPLDEQEALTLLTKWNLDNNTARSIVSLFTDVYKYWGSTGDRFTIIGTVSDSNIFIVTRTPSTQKSANENEIVLTKDAQLLAGSAILRENVNGIAWTSSDTHGMMQIFVANQN